MAAASLSNGSFTKESFVEPLKPEFYDPHLFLYKPLCLVCNTTIFSLKNFPCGHTTCVFCLKYTFLSDQNCPVCVYNRAVNPQINYSNFAGANEVYCNSIDSGNISDSSNQIVPFCSPLVELSSPSTGAIPKTRNRCEESGQNSQVPSANAGYREHTFYNQPKIEITNNYKLSTSLAVGGEIRNSKLVPKNWYLNIQREEIISKKMEVTQVLNFPRCSHIPLEYYCTDCLILTCASCSQRHKDHTVILISKDISTLRSLIYEAENELTSHEEKVTEFHDNVSLTINDLDLNYELIDKTINGSINILRHLVQCTKEEHLKALRNVVQYKVEKVSEQIKDLKDGTQMLIELQNLMQAKLMPANNEEDLIKSYNLLSKLNQKWKSIFEVVSHETPKIMFETCYSKILPDINNFGNIYSSSTAENTVISGIGILKAILNENSHFIIECRDNNQAQCAHEENSLKVTLTYPSGKKTILPLTYYKNGLYGGKYLSGEPGEHTLTVHLRGYPISNCINRPIGVEKRTLNEVQFPPKIHFAESLSRGWGLCCDDEGIIYATDRNLHCVFLYGPNLNYLTTFGIHGVNDGEFNRPTGITVDACKRIVVADKDNHRIQIFSRSGEFRLKFGKRGVDKGEFDYPWDVATNSECQIAVSDSKNARIQLFSKDGIFLTATDNCYRTPRGVCFDQYGKLYVTQFEYKTLLLFDVQSSTIIFHYLSRAYFNLQTRRYEEYDRPQGIFITKSGQIIIAQAKAHSILVVTKGFECTGRSIAYTSKNPDVLKTFNPCNVAVSPDGYLYALDIDMCRIHRM